MVVFAAAVALVVGALAKDAVRFFLDRPTDLRSRETLAKIASEINKSMPMNVDGTTEAMNAGAAEGVLIYNYRLLEVDADEIAFEELRESQGPSLVAVACSTPQTRDHFLRNDVTLRYSYHDRSRQLLGSIDVRPEDCGL